MSYRIGFKNGRVMSNVGNQPQQDRYRSANRRPEVGRSRFFAGVPGRPGRTAPAVRPLPFHTPGSQSYKYDDGLDRGVRVRVGNYMVDMGVGAEENQALETTLEIAETADPTGIVGKLRSVYTLAKSWFGGPSKTDQDRTAKINKYFEAGGQGQQLVGYMNAVLEKVKTAGADWNMVGKPKSLDNWFIQILNTYALLSSAQGVAQGYKNGKDSSGGAATLTERADAIDRVVELANTLAGYLTNATNEMKAGTTDPYTWSRYREKGTGYEVDKWTGSAFALQTITAAEKTKRTQMAINGNIPAAQPPTPPATPVTVTIPATKPTLRKGSTGEAVKQLQTILLSLSYATGVADGIFGANTEAAVKKFQAAYGLTADGIVGANTWAKIESVLGGTTATVTPGGGGEVTITTPGGGTKIIPDGSGGGGSAGGSSVPEVSFLQKPVFWLLALGAVGVLGAGGYLMTRKK